MRLLLTLFESKPHIIVIFHYKTNRQKLEKYHVNGSQARTHFKLSDSFFVVLMAGIILIARKGRNKIAFYFIIENCFFTLTMVGETSLISTHNL